MNGYKLFVDKLGAYSSKNWTLNLLVGHSIDFSELMFAVISSHKPKHILYINIQDLTLKADAAFLT